MKKEILKQLKSDYERLEIKPSADLWDRIEQETENKTVLSYKKPFQWLKYAAVIVLCASLGTFIYYSNYKTTFDYQETDSLVWKTLDHTVSPNNINIETQSVVPNREPVEKSELKIAKENHNKSKADKVLIPKEEIKLHDIQFTEHKEERTAYNQPEKIIISHEKTENIPTSNFPVIAEVKKSSYISADELLLGREIDKTRLKSNNDVKRMGVVNLDRVVPNIGNVTVLGVTVYIESK
jgi:hypothetical protein